MLNFNLLKIFPPSQKFNVAKCSICNFYHRININTIKGRKDFCGDGRIIFLIIFKTTSAFKGG